MIELCLFDSPSHNMMLSDSHAAKLLVCHAGLEPRTSRAQADLLLTRLSRLGQARGDTSVKHNRDTGSDNLSRKISIWHTRPHLAWQDADLKAAGSDKIPNKASDAEAQQHKGAEAQWPALLQQQQQRLASKHPSALPRAQEALQHHHKQSQGAAAKTVAKPPAKGGLQGAKAVWDKLVSWINPHATATAPKLRQRTALPPQAPLGDGMPNAPECLESHRLLSLPTSAGTTPPLLRMQSTAETAAAARQWTETDTPTVRSRPISQIVHQTWKECSLSSRQAAWRESCRQQLPPSWRIVLWTDAQNRALVAQRCPAMLGIYDRYPRDIMRADAVRLCYMYAFGGVYIDLDFACLRPPAPLLEAAGSRPVLGAAIANHTRRGGMVVRGAIGNAFMASPPGHPFFAFAIARLEPAFEMMMRFKMTRSGATLVLGSTGPNFLTRTVHEYQALLPLNSGVNVQGVPGADLVVQPLHRIYGVEWTPEGRHPCDGGADLARCAQRLPDAVTTTFWTHSWK